MPVCLPQGMRQTSIWGALVRLGYAFRGTKEIVFAAP